MVNFDCLNYHCWLFARKISTIIRRQFWNNKQKAKCVQHLCAAWYEIVSLEKKVEMLTYGNWLTLATPWNIINDFAEEGAREAEGARRELEADRGARRREPRHGDHRRAGITHLQNPLTFQRIRHTVESGYTLWNLNFSWTVAGITKWYWITIERYLSYLVQKFEDLVPTSLSSGAI